MATGALGLTVLTDLENTSILLDEHNDLEVEILICSWSKTFFSSLQKQQQKKETTTNKALGIFTTCIVIRPNFE